MMAVLELYGKCKELGYCDCSGFFGCVDPRPPAPKPVIENELATAMKAEQEVSHYHNHNYRRELEAIDQSQGALVECEVCDRSHLPNHPHISNIEGDTPFDDVEPVQRKADPIISLPPPDDQLPEWLRDRPAEEVRRTISPGKKYVRCAATRGRRGMHASVRKRRAPGLSMAAFRNLNRSATPAARSSAAITTARLSPRPTRQRSHWDATTANVPASSASGMGECG
jgi:hypothetical protein